MCQRVEGGGKRSTDKPSDDTCFVYLPQWADGSLYNWSSRCRQHSEEPYPRSWTALLAEGRVTRLASWCLRFGRLVRATVNRDAPGQLFGFAFVGYARSNERVIAGLGTFHRIPLTLLTDGIHPAHLPVDRHAVDYPRHGLLGLSHQISSPPQE